MKKWVFIVGLLLAAMPVMAYTLDVSVNKEIQRQHDADKLNKDMNSANRNKTNSSAANKSKPVPSTMPVFDNETPVITKDNTSLKYDKRLISTHIKLKVKSNQKISNWQSVGSTVTFTTTETLYKKHITIPVGTLLTGKITNVHKPQITGNGGLVEIKIVSINYNGKTIPVEGKVTKADSEWVFFNKIKGERQYLNGVKKKVKSANNFYSKSRQMSNKLSQNPIGTLISPIPTVVGFVGSSVGTIASPITGLVQKGGNVSFPKGTSFTIKLIKM